MFDRSGLLIVFADEPMARLLTGYLNSQNVGAELIVGSAPYPYQVFVLDAQQWPQAVEIKNQFLANPSDRSFQDAAWTSGKGLSKPLPFSFGHFDWIANVKKFPIVILTIVACLLVYLGLNIQGAPVFYSLQFQPFEQLTATGQWWRLWTPAFIHFSSIHIIFNLLWWWILGRALEAKFGHVFLTVFFFATALTSNYAQFLVAGDGFGGLSGVVYALFGFVWWVGWLKPAWGLRLPKALIGFMLIWLVLGYADLLWVNMANTAHTAGLLSGCVIALLLSRASLFKSIKS